MLKTHHRLSKLGLSLGAALLVSGAAGSVVRGPAPDKQRRSSGDRGEHTAARGEGPGGGRHFEHRRSSDLGWLLAPRFVHH